MNIEMVLAITARVFGNITTKNLQELLKLKT